MILRVHIPGNPWQGAINRRDRASVSSKGKPYNRKLSGYVEAQNNAAAWTRAAVNAQGVWFTRGPVVVTATWYVDRRSRQYDLPAWCPAADVDGPGKCYLDALRKTIKRGRKVILGGGAMSDDVQVVDYTQRKRYGDPRAEILVRLWTEADG